MVVRLMKLKHPFLVGRVSESSNNAVFIASVRCKISIHWWAEVDCGHYSVIRHPISFLLVILVWFWSCRSFLFSCQSTFDPPFLLYLCFTDASCRYSFASQMVSSQTRCTWSVDTTVNSRYHLLKCSIIRPPPGAPDHPSRRLGTSIL